ncbi:hypothetical protein LMTR3_22345 [Bradyrhizobium sp. LMTR 3]|nr:hypothetical protein LMTR3_22345 [Bradyrhizobium sp. LMTR 3]
MQCSEAQCTTVLAIEILQELGREQRDLTAALAQGRQQDGHDDAMVEVSRVTCFAPPPLEIAVDRVSDSTATLIVRCVDALELLLLQNTEQLLERWRDLTDLVEGLPCQRVESSGAGSALR